MKSLENGNDAPQKKPVDIPHWGIYLQFMFYFAISFLISHFVQAHPVTYQGGTMLKNMAREDMSETSVTYSFHRRLAVGMEYDRLQLGVTDTSWGIAEFNGLVQRWNGDHSQANIYVLTGVGTYWDNQKEESFAYKWGIQADYETRQIYTLAQFLSWHSDLIDTNYALYRLGFAPFTAGYNDLNIWCIMQLDYNKDMRSEVQVTPFLRFYFKNVLWEVGASLRGNFYGQFMVHL